MKEPYIHLLSKPQLRDPILICGLPGIGNIGSIAAGLVIGYSQAKLLAELYSPSFADYVFIGDEGICHPPRYEFYASNVQGRDVVILTGDALPSIEDIPAYYEVCGKVLDLATDLGCRFIITLDGIASPQVEREIYVVATSEQIAANVVKKGAVIYRGNRVIGPSGLLLGLAREQGLRGFCLLSSTHGLATDKESASHVYKFLIKHLETHAEEGL